MTAIRSKLIAARHRKGLSQQEAAILLQVTRATLSQWERGITNPYPFHVSQLCKFYEVDNPANLDLDLIQLQKKIPEQSTEIQEVIEQQEHQERENTPLDRVDRDLRLSHKGGSKEGSFLTEIEEHTVQQAHHEAQQGMTDFSSPAYERQAPLFPMTSLPALADPSLWMGSKLSHILSTIEYYCTQPTSCLELQTIIDRELTIMPPHSKDEAYTLSRRQLLITLSALPSALLFALLQGWFSAGQIELFLGRCAASLAACWQLMRGSEYSLVEDLLSSYLSLLVTLAQDPASKYRCVAASLTTQAYRLKGILALHRNNARDRNECFNQAIYYAELSQNPGLLVAALISAGYHKTNPIEANKLYQRALVYEKVISPLQLSRLYAQMSVVYAQQNQDAEALHYLDNAQKIYPEIPENDPCFVYAEFSPSSLVLEKGRMYLTLAHQQQDTRYSKQAWDTFVSVEEEHAKHVGSERIRYEIVNYKAETALVMGERDLCCDYIELGARGAELLKSAKRRNEVIVTRNKALKVWQQDSRVQGLKMLFAGQRKMLIEPRM